MKTKNYAGYFCTHYQRSVGKSDNNEFFREFYFIFKNDRTI